MVEKKAHTVAVFELEVDASDPCQWVRVVTSLPGREGTLNRTWAVKRGLLDGPQVQDLGAAVAAWVIDGVVMSLGVQQGLPL